MTVRKNKSLYTPGYISLYDTQGNLFFRARTELEPCYDEWKPDASDRGACDEQVEFLTQDNINNEHFATLYASACLLDVPSLYGYHKDLVDYRYAGHFSLEKAKSGFEFQFVREFIQHTSTPDDGVVFVSQSPEFDILSIARRLHVRVD